MTTDTIMYHKTMREIKEHFELESAELSLRIGAEQVALTHNIDMAKNELHYCNQSMRKEGADVDALKARLDAAVERINELSQKKVRLDYDRKCAVISLRRQRDAQILELEQRLNQAQQAELDEYGKEVAV